MYVTAYWPPGASNLCRGLGYLLYSRRGRSCMRHRGALHCTNSARERAAATDPEKLRVSSGSFRRGGAPETADRLKTP